MTDTETFHTRLRRIRSEITLAENFDVRIGQDEEVPHGRFYFQIRCYRRDVITGEMGYGFGGKAYLSPHATDSELVQTVFGLYKAYWEHEARESFQWRERRVFGPHIATEALWEVARKVDVRSAKHVEDKSLDEEVSNIRIMAGLSPEGCVESGTHRPVQHRDGKEPWCKSCGQTKDGKEPISKIGGKK